MAAQPTGPTMRPARACCQTRPGRLLDRLSSAYLDRQGVNSRLRDCATNRTLIDRKTNIQIADRSPSMYMGEIRRALGADKFDELLQLSMIA